MHNNAGRTLKAIAIVLVILAGVITILLGIQMIAHGGIYILVIGFFSAFVIGALIYAIGQIAEDTSEIVYLLKMQRDENKTTEEIVKEVVGNANDPITTKAMLNAWFVEGLISEEEYIEKIKLFSKDDD